MKYTKYDNGIETHIFLFVMTFIGRKTKTILQVYKRFQHKSLLYECIKFAN